MTLSEAAFLKEYLLFRNTLQITAQLLEDLGRLINGSSMLPFLCFMWLQHLLVQTDGSWVMLLEVNVPGLPGKWLIPISKLHGYLLKENLFSPFTHHLVAAPNMAMMVLDTAMQVHGAAGLSGDTVLAHLWSTARTVRIADAWGQSRKLS